MLKFFSVYTKSYNINTIGQDMDLKIYKLIFRNKINLFGITINLAKDIITNPAIQTLKTHQIARKWVQSGIMIAKLPSLAAKQQNNSFTTTWTKCLCFIFSYLGSLPTNITPGTAWWKTIVWREKIYLLLKINFWHHNSLSQ